MPKARTEAEIEDIASDAAGDATPEQFSALESRLDDLEGSKDELETELQTLKSDHEELVQKHNELADMYASHSHSTY